MPKFDEVEVDKIDISDANVRKTAISREEFESLVASIKAKGVLAPVTLVRKGERYEMPIGQNRYLAAKEAGLQKVPALIYDKMDPTTMRSISAIENLQRIDLSPADRAGAIADLVKDMGSPKEVAKALGYSEGWVRYWLGFKGLPEPVKEMVGAGKISTDEAAKLRPMLKWGDPGKVIEVAEEISKLPRGGVNRKKALDVIKHKPSVTAEEIKTEVKKSTFLRTKIVIEVSDTEVDALRRAADEADQSPTEMAHTIVSDWLRENRYLT